MRIRHRCEIPFDEKLCVIVVKEFRKAGKLDDSQTVIWRNNLFTLKTVVLSKECFYPLTEQSKLGKQILIPYVNRKSQTVGLLAYPNLDKLFENAYVCRFSDVAKVTVGKVMSELGVLKKMWLESCN